MEESGQGEEAGLEESGQGGEAGLEKSGQGGEAGLEKGSLEAEGRHRNPENICGRWIMNVVTVISVLIFIVTETFCVVSE